MEKFHNILKQIHLLADQGKQILLQLWDDHLALRNMRHGENIGVCIGIFTTALGGKHTIKFSLKNTSTYFQVHSLLSQCLLCWHEAILANYPFLGFLPLREVWAWAAGGIFRLSDRAFGNGVCSLVLLLGACLLLVWQQTTAFAATAQGIEVQH